MTEEATLSIMRCGNTYQVRYASNNPHTMDRQLYTCIDKEHLEAFLPQVGIAPWYITQVHIELRKSGCAILPIVLSVAQRQAFFPLPNETLSVRR